MFKNHLTPKKREVCRHRGIIINHLKDSWFDYMVVFAVGDRKGEVGEGRIGSLKNLILKFIFCMICLLQTSLLHFAL